MGRHKEYWAGYRKMVIELCMEYGFISRKYLTLLVAPNQKVMLRRLGEMINEGVISKYSYDHKTVIGLNKNNINTIASYYGYDIKEHYVNYAEKTFDTYRWKKNRYVDNSRLYEAGIIGCMLYGLCDSITGDKKEIESAVSPTYYTSIEYKKDMAENGNIQTLQSTGSRNFGILKRNKDLYLIYQLKAKYKMDYIAESKTILSVNKYGIKKNAGKYEGSIAFIKDYGVVRALLNDLSRPLLSTVRDVLKKCLVYETTKTGKEQLNLFIKGHDVIKRILTPEQINGAKGLTCDGYDENGYHLVFCEPDLVKLMDFIDMAAVKDDDFIIYVYKNQLPVIEPLKDRMKVKLVNFEKLRETFSDNKK